MLEIEKRGRGASGVAWWGTNATGDPRLLFQKDPLKASDFVKAMNLPEDQDVRLAIAHTRAPTQGDKADNRNNHPIVVGQRICGVHNGVIWNDDSVFRDLNSIMGRNVREAVVDSEAIFATLVYSNETTPGAAFEKYVDGSAAVAWLDTETPDTLWLSRISDSPCIFHVTDGGSVVFASTKKAIDDGLKAAGLRDPGWKEYTELEEGDVMQFRPDEDGSIVLAHMEQFRPPEKFGRAAWYDLSDGYSGGGKSTTVIGTPPKKDEPAKGSEDDTPVEGPADPVSVNDSLRHGHLTDALLSRPIEQGDYCHWPNYAERDRQVEAWIENRIRDLEHQQERELFVRDDSPVVRAYDEAAEKGANLRSGDWVVTSLAGADLSGQIVSMPNHFPGGEYAIRVYLPITPDFHETALVMREAEDFTYLNSVGNGRSEDLINHGGNA